MTSMQVCGTEWVSHVTCRRKLMDELLPAGTGPGVGGGGERRTGRRTGGGSGGRRWASGQAPCTHARHLQRDGLPPEARAGLQRGGAADRRAHRVARRADRRRSPRAPGGAPRAPLARNGSRRRSRSDTSCPIPVAPRIDFDPDKLLREDESLGLGPGRARARHSDVAVARRPRPREDPDYRFAVVQSELYRRYLRLAVQRLDVGPLALYLKHLARWYLERERGEPRRAGRADAARPQRARARPGGGAVSTLLVDNYDSYTYNVFHLLAAVSGEEPIVVHNDMVSWRALSRWDFDAIVLSPGPGRPERWHDFGVCSDILRSSEIPVLGICLGHQGLGHVLDGLVATRADGDARAPEPGPAPRQRPLRGHPPGLLGRALPLARGHRSARARGSRDRLDRRRRGDGHRTPPPPAVGCAVPPRVGRDRARPQAGRELLRARARRRLRLRRARRAEPTGLGAAHRAARASRRAPAPAATRVQLRVRTLAGEPSTELLFERLFGDAELCLLARQRRRADAPGAVLLPRHERGPDRCVLEYDVEAGR